MKKGSTARRIPRKIGSDDDEPTATTDEGGTARSTIVRPTSKPHKASSVRTAFNPGASEDEDTLSTGVVAPKRSKLSKLAIQRNASQRSSLLGASLPKRDLNADDDGPSYSVAELKQLKESTPTTPRDLTTDASSPDIDDVASDTRALDISAKFGTSLSRYQQLSAIPSATEIAEKKARRARLAKEQAAEDYISLDPSDPELDKDDDDDENTTRDERGRLVLKPRDKYKDAESRLTQDDEDIMETFDEFTEADGQLAFSRRAEVEVARKRKADMAAQIALAEGALDSDSDASERERNEAFEASQTKHGTYGSHTTSDDRYADIRPKTPPKISPLPTLDGVIERLRKQVADLQTSRMQRLQEMEALQREKIRLGEEEIRIQRALKETAEKFQQMRAEKGVAESSTATTDTVVAARLLDAPGSDLPSEVDSDAEGIMGGRTGLGLGLAGKGLGFLGPPAEDGSDSEGNGREDALMTESYPN